jgi:hypothetical protein
MLCLLRLGSTSVPIWKLVGQDWKKENTFSFANPSRGGSASADFGAKNYTLYAGYFVLAKEIGKEKMDDRDVISTAAFVKIDNPWKGSDSVPLGMQATVRGWLEHLLFTGSVKVSPDEKWLFVSLWNRILQFEITSGKEGPFLNVAGASEIGFSPDSAYMCAVSTRQVLVAPETMVERAVSVWTMKAGHRRVCPDIKLRGPYAFVFTRDSKRIIFADDEWRSGLRILDLREAKLTRTVALSHPCRQLVFAPDGTLSALEHDFPIGRSVFVRKGIIVPDDGDNGKGTNGTRTKP